MSRVCHETRQNIYNPFYTMGAVLRDKGNNRLASSNLEVSLSSETARKLPLSGLPNSPEQMEENVFYAIEQAGGTEGGLTGAVQLVSGYESNGSPKYVSRKQASSKLPKSAKDLLANPEWVELVGGKYQPAEWANELYAKSQK